MCSRGSSKAPSAEPVSGTPVGNAPLSEEEYAEIELNRGAPARQYLDKGLNPVLLNGLRELTKRRPKDPVKWLGKYLVEHSEDE